MVARQFRGRQLVERARIVLLAAEGLSGREIARRLKTRLARVSKWRQRFARQGVAGLHDAPRSGTPRTYAEATEKRLLALLDTPPPQGYSQWNGRLLAEALGDVSDDQVWRLPRQHKIPLQRRRQFLDFMNDVVAQHPDTEVHVILDNLNTHKPKLDRWRKRHPEVHFHFIPTYSSWLNRVEVWFSILSRQALRNLSATSVPQPRKAIDRIVGAYAETATPFEWTKAMVEPSAPRRRYSDLCK